MRIFGSLAFAIVAASSFASVYGVELFPNSRDKLVSFGGTFIDSSSGDDTLVGVGYNTESIKGSLQKGSDTLAGSLAVKLNVADRTYAKAAFAYTEHDYPWNMNSKFYSGSLGLGYLVCDDFYVEAGVGKSKTDYDPKSAISGKTTDSIYVGATKRLETQIGTVDLRGSAGRIYPPLGEDENYYTAGLVVYPKNNMRIGYTYNYMKDRSTNNFSFEYGYLIASYSDTLNEDHQVAFIGAQFAFSDVLNITTYSMPQNIKRHISE